MAQSRRSCLWPCSGSTQNLVGQAWRGWEFVFGHGRGSEEGGNEFEDLHGTLKEAWSHSRARRCRGRFLCWCDILAWQRPASSSLCTDISTPLSRFLQLELDVRMRRRLQGTEPRPLIGGRRPSHSGLTYFQTDRLTHQLLQLSFHPAPGLAHVQPRECIHSEPGSQALCSCHSFNVPVVQIKREVHWRASSGAPAGYVGLVTGPVFEEEEGDLWFGNKGWRRKEKGC